MQVNPNTIGDTYIGIQWNSNPANQSIVSYNVRINGGNLINVPNTVSNVIGYVANGLSPGTNYTFEVQSVNILGVTSSFSTITATTLPSPPFNLQLSVVSSTQINISWSPNPANQNVVSYIVQITGGNPITGITSTSYSATGLLPSTNYSFSVRAVTSTGAISTPSGASGTTLAALTPPPAGVSNAVYDYFSTQNHQFSMWQYGVKSSATSFTRYLHNGQVVNGVNAWSENPGGICCTMVARNITAATLLYQGVINQPIDMLNLHPGVNGEKAAVRWTAQVSGFVRLQGRFEGIDIAGTSSDGNIIKNGTSIWSNNINGYGAKANFDMVVQVNAGDVIDFAVGYGSNNTYYNDSTGVDINISPKLPPSGIYNAVNDFSTTSNSNGAWWYGEGGYKGYTDNGQIVNGVSAWSLNASGRCCSMVAKNTTGSSLTYQGVINQPPDMLNLHPGVYGEKATVVWRSPVAGYFRVVGRFQGIDMAGTTSDVSISHNGSVIWTNDINGFGATAAFDMVVQVGIGEGVAFEVGYGSNKTYYNDSTGLMVDITPTTARPI
ncbi:MAG: fibronectin type III domain-containing protein [Blastocatellia bacterium]|nr:fibronectin type III domain-containing protein [Blastocatellia bacterium]